MNAKTEAKVRAHGETLLAMFPSALERDPVRLCRKLRRLEREASAIGLRLCNGPEYGEGEADAACDAVLGKVNALLGNAGGVVPVFVNRDPRGYALKIDADWMASRLTREAYDRGAAITRLHRDLGGYGIIAPDLTE